MTRSLAFDFLGLYAALLKDIAAYYPNDRVEWDRDISNLTRLYQTRGQAIFTMDLPALGKALDMSLSKGRLSLESLNLSGSRFPGSKIPRLFWGLWVRLFDEGGLRADVDPNCVLFLRTLLYVGKNLEWECSPRYLFEATGEFYDIEARLPPPSQVWEEDGSVLDHRLLGHLNDLAGDSERWGLFPSGDSSLRATLDSVQREADWVVGQLGFFDPDCYRFRHGPGSVSDLRNGEFKYEFPNWSRRLSFLFPYDRFGLVGVGMLDRIGPDGLDHCEDEQCSRLIAVPKSQKGPRLIAAEPTCHQWVQQCVRDFVYTNVQHSALSLSVRFNDQAANREAAVAGSLDGSLATVDLKSASDRLSCYVVQRVFRKNISVLRAMIASRTRWISNGIDAKRPSLHKLRKFSTQGSALTFPVQSLVFLSVALGVGRLLEPNLSRRGCLRKVRVFGDDIVVPTQWVGALMAALTAMGLKVNQTKTFTEGNFRESCGMDAWRGYDVTPPHVTKKPIKSEPSSVVSNTAVSNNFYTKGFWNAASWLVDQLPQSIPVVGSRSGTFGFKTFGKAPEPTRKRWNKDLHRDETQVLTVVAKARRVKQNAAGALLQFFTEEPTPYVKYESGVPVAGVPVFKHAWVPVADLW